MSAAPFYYEPVDRAALRFAPTAATSSPWDDEAQHGGPPTALLAHCIGVAHPRPDTIVARVSTDFLGPIPKRVLEVHTRVLRAGKRVELSEASLVDPRDGRIAVVLRAWRIRTAELALPVLPPADAVPPLPPEQPQRYLPGLTSWGYGEATEWRFVTGGLDALGRADVWTRVRVPLVAGVPLDPLARTLIVADSTNGISVELPIDSFLSIPPGLTVTLGRYPAGDWVFLGARSLIFGGSGIAEARLGDPAGVFGAATQPLLIDPRA